MNEDKQVWLRVYAASIGRDGRPAYARQVAFEAVEHFREQFRG